MKLRCLSPNSYIHVSVRDLYNPTFGLLILLQKNTVVGPVVRIYKSFKGTVHECANWD
jgi:hypothetical protein